MFPVGQADVKISVRPSLTGCEAVNSNNQQDHELNLWVTDRLTARVRAYVCVCVRACSYVKQGEICTNGVTQTKNEGLTEDPHT